MSFINKQFLLSAVAASILAGCGGGGSSTPAPQQPAAHLNGKAIDGYIVGANVFLDLNFNGVLDSGEPSVTTKGEGDFALPISSSIEQCAKYVPIVVDVPVGAIDLDTPDTPIDEAYTMVIPPQFAIPTDEDLLNVTPLTTVIWDDVQRVLAKNNTGALSCDSILKDVELREEISTQVDKQAYRFATRYNATIGDVFKDYIEDGDTGMYDLAVSLVPSLQASFRETHDIQTSYPNAELAWVDYYYKEVSDGTYPLHRTQFVQSSDGNLEEITHLAFDFGSLDAVVQYDLMTSSQRDGLNIQYTITGARNESTLTYDCSRYEEIKTIDGVEQYGIVNSVFDNFPNLDECKSVSDGNITQSKVYTLTNLDGVSGGEFAYHQDNLNVDRNLIGIADTITRSDILGFVSGVDFNFESEDGHGSDFWFRNWGRTENGEHISTIHNISGQWEQTVTHADGTHTCYCGTSQDNMIECQR